MSLQAFQDFIDEYPIALQDEMIAFLADEYDEVVSQ